MSLMPNDIIFMLTILAVILADQKVVFRGVDLRITDSLTLSKP